jgi:hypothetical protein
MVVTKKHKKYQGVMPSYKAVIKGMIEVQDSAEVDGVTWYIIQVNPRVTPWIRQQNKDLWYNHITPNYYKVVDTFDVHEKLYTMLALRWA